MLMGKKSWPRASTPDDLLEEARLGVAEGFTAIKVDPFVEGDDGFQCRHLPAGSTGRSKFWENYGQLSVRMSF